MNPKRLFFSALLGAVAVALFCHTAMAKQFTVGGRPLNLFGYVTQLAAFSAKDIDYYDTEQDLQSALFTLFLEGDYSLAYNLKFYASTNLNVDWIYDIKHDDKSWNDKLFSKSRDKLYIDDHYWQILKEAHLTWTPGNFFFRIGKQIVKWGETDGFRLMDQINPGDQRRGMSDVEFETSIIPIWLVRAEYFLPKKPTWVQDLGFEFIFNPNLDFLTDTSMQLGNDKGGIWTPNVIISLPPPPIGPGQVHIGSAAMDLKKPDSHFDDNGFEYGFRLKGIIKDAVITLNYFYGLDNSPVTISPPPPGPPGPGGPPPGIELASDGLPIIHPALNGFYPLFRLFGATFNRDFTSLRSTFLGGVAPLLRLETFYAYENTFPTSNNTFEKKDELRWAIGIDWKVKINFLNPRAYFMVSPQFYHRKIFNYPHSYDLSGAEADNYMTSLMIATSYFHNKISPSFFWLRDINNRADFFKLQVTYDRSNAWHYSLGALLLGGMERGRGFEVFDNKDQIYFKISYRWG